MADTIRQYLKRRARRSQMIAGVLWVGLLAIMVFVPGRKMIPWFLVGFAAFAGAVLYGLYARCPKCRAVLGHCVAGRIAFKGGRLFPKPKFCPYCGVSFEEPCPNG